MKLATGVRLSLVFAMAAALWPASAAGQEAAVLPSPLTLADVVRLAGERRDEIQVARARVRAAEQRPAIVSALEDPMIAPAIDHKPFMMSGADVSLTIEQRISLSGVRGHRRTSALADVDRLRAEVRRTALDVGVQAANAFLMLQERRLTTALVAEQITFVVNTSNWWGGHKVLISPQWVAEVNWPESIVSLDLSREQIQGAPPYDAEALFERQHEQAMHEHYGRPTYWAEEP